MLTAVTNSYYTKKDSKLAFDDFYANYESGEGRPRPTPYLETPF